MFWITLTFIIGLPLLIKWYLRDYERNRILSNIPGPKKWPIFGTTLKYFRVKREDLFNSINESRKKYPGICLVWMGPKPDVRLSKAEYIERLINHSTENLSKASGYMLLTKWLGEGLLTSTGERWHKHRKIITPTFHFSILHDFCEVFNEKTKILIERFRPFSDTGKPINIYPFITKATLDIICDSAMGTQINAQNDDENEYVKSITIIGDVFFRRLLRPWLYNDFIFSLTADGKKFNKCLRIVQNFTTKVIQERKIVIENAAKSKKIEVKDTEKSTTVTITNTTTNHQDNEIPKRKRLAFLDLLLEANSKENLLSDRDIREEVDTFMFEGHDTTASGLSWALSLIGENDDVQEKIFEEIDNIFRSADSKRANQEQKMFEASVPSLHDLNAMKYLERVIKESLRLYPPVSFYGRTVSKDVELGKYTIPKGCSSTIEAYRLHRDERFFPDPEKFDPDRFLPDNITNRHPFAYLPFSAGPRNCIGQKFALLEEKAVISAIIRNYKIKSVHKSSEVLIANELTLRPLNGIQIYLEKRV